MSKREHLELSTISLGNGEELRRDTTTNEWYLWSAGMRVNRLSEYDQNRINCTVTATMVHVARLNLAHARDAK